MFVATDLFHLQKKRDQVLVQFHKADLKSPYFKSPLFKPHLSFHHIEIPKDSMSCQKWIWTQDVLSEKNTAQFQNRNMAFK